MPYKKTMKQEIKKTAPTEPATTKVASSLFIIPIILGFLIAIYIYIFNFNTYSETMMIMLSPFWVIPIAFGYYGRLALKMQKRFDQSEEKSFSDMIDFVIKSMLINYLGVIVFLPFKLVKSNNPILIALLGAILWAVLLLFFFLAIFPML